MKIKVLNKANKIVIIESKDLDKTSKHISGRDFTSDEIKGFNKKAK